jgi:hypothetical protein
MVYKTLLAATALLCAVGPTELLAKGCVRGAIVGGVAGHYAGHHAVAGAAAGCVIAHHHYAQQARARRAAAHPH